jgi:hypothetical protein
MTREQKLKLVWRHTHRDYKGKVNGERTILMYCEGEGTCLVFLKSLTDEQLDARIPRAVKENAA